MPVEHTVPVTLVQQLVDLVQRWRVPPAELLAGSAFSERPTDPSGRLPLGAMTALLERARSLTGEPGLGYYLALKERASTYGYLGLAASTTSTINDAVRLITKYAPVFSSALSMKLRVEGDHAFLCLDENADLGKARDIVLIHLMLGLETLASSLTGQQWHAAAELAIPEPAYNARFTHLVPRWRFGQPANRLMMPARVLDLPIVHADPVSLELMRPLCERALAELDDGLVERVCRSVVRESGGFRSLEEVAKEMAFSRRTLTRRLAAQGTAFSSLVERARQEQALALLRSSALSIRQIAQQLDYANASTFVRAFRGWTGRTPGAYRRGASGCSPPPARHGY